MISLRMYGTHSSAVRTVTLVRYLSSKDMFSPSETPLQLRAGSGDNSCGDIPRPCAAGAGVPPSPAVYASRSWGTQSRLARQLLRECSEPVSTLIVLSGNGGECRLAM